MSHLHPHLHTIDSRVQSTRRPDSRGGTCMVSLQLEALDARQLMTENTDTVFPVWYTYTPYE